MSHFGSILARFVQIALNPRLHLPTTNWYVSQRCDSAHAARNSWLFKVIK